LMFFQSHGDSSKMKRVELNVLGRELANMTSSLDREDQKESMSGLA
jgi:hypothetical protein